MGIELYWDNDEQTVMLCEVDRSWTWEEMDAVLDKVKKVTDRSEYTIGAILDLRQGVHFPGGTIFTPTALSHARKMLKMGEGTQAGTRCRRRRKPGDPNDLQDASEESTRTALVASRSPPRSKKHGATLMQYDYHYEETAT